MVEDPNLWEDFDGESLGAEDAAAVEQEARAEREAIEAENVEGERALGVSPLGEPSHVPDAPTPPAPVGGALVGGLVAELLAAREERRALGVYLRPEESEGWEGRLRYAWKRDPDGTLRKAGLLKSPANLVTLLMHDPQWSGRLRFNAMSLYPQMDGRTVADSDLTAMRVAFEHRHGLIVGRDAMSEAVRLASEANPFDPRADWLNSLPAWDGKKRLDRVCETFFGAQHPLYATYVKCFLLGAIRRVVEPGCRMQSVFTLLGPQGFKKSTFFGVLFGEWFSDTKIDFGSPREAAIQIAGAWCHELGECEELTLYREDTATKRGITSTRDTFRRPYATTTETVKRSSFFVGTTNEEAFLKDRTGTGSRRWHVVRVFRRVEEELLRAWRDQLFAEAIVLHRQGVPHWLTDEEDVLREASATDHYQVDIWDDLLTNYLSRREKLYEVEKREADGSTVRRWAVPTVNVLSGALGFEQGKATDADTRHLGVCFRRLGWTRGKERFRRGTLPTKGAPESCYLAPLGWDPDQLLIAEETSAGEIDL